MGILSKNVKNFKVYYIEKTFLKLFRHPMTFFGWPVWHAMIFLTCFSMYFRDTILLLFDILCLGFFLNSMLFYHSLTQYNRTRSNILLFNDSFDMLWLFMWTYYPTFYETILWLLWQCSVAWLISDIWTCDFF